MGCREERLRGCLDDTGYCGRSRNEKEVDELKILSISVYLNTNSLKPLEVTAILRSDPHLNLNLQLLTLTSLN